MVDPELPQSNGIAGCANEPAHPCISTVPDWRSCSTCAPSARMHAKVLAQSAPLEKLWNLLRPAAIAASIA
jgi:hypothetical protein